MFRQFVFGFVVVLSLCFVLPAHARITIWHGEYQDVNNSAVKRTAPATVRTVRRHSKRRMKKDTRYVCTFGKRTTRDVFFSAGDCLRRGTHILCSKSAPPAPANKSRGWTGDVCWGDIHLKKKAP
jgi:hypothetical protein